MINFLLILFFIGILIASIQDLRRREVDNYLNFFLLVSGMAFAIFSAVWGDWKIGAYAFLSLGILLVLANIFYYGRIFAGGDAKLMIAMAGLFAASSLYSTLLNIGLFILFLLFSGAIYGSVYSIVMVARNFEVIKKSVRKHWYRSYFLVMVGGIILAFMGFFNFIFLIIGILVFILPILFVAAKAIEKEVMIKRISSKELREGDWLAEDVKYRGKLIKQDWEGITRAQIRFFRNYKRKIMVKDGLPFVPAFLIAFIFWVFREQLIRLVLGF